MRIYIELPKRLRHSGVIFSRFIISHLQSDVNKLLQDSRVRTRIAYVLASEWIRDRELLSKLDEDALQSYIEDAIRYKRFEDYYIIEFDPNVALPNSRVSVESIIRFVNYGNESMKGCYLFSKLFLKYQKNIYKYWRAFCLRSQLNCRR